MSLAETWNFIYMHNTVSIPNVKSFSKKKKEYLKTVEIVLRGFKFARVKDGY